MCIERRRVSVHPVEIGKQRERERERERERGIERERRKKRGRDGSYLCTV